MSIPNYDLPDYPWQDDVDYPVAHNCNVCRKCLPDQLARASHGRLVKADPLHLFTIAAYMLVGLAIGQHEVEGTVAGLVLAGVVLGCKALLLKLTKEE